MRIRSTVVVLLIAIAGATAIPIAGQEEPLTPSVYLAVDPIHTTAPPTLADAVRANDYASFDALYRDAVRRGESVAAYATLHELWTYSVTDPIGAFYGPDLYDRLTRAYPGYAKYIDDYRIVDSNGNAFYPTSETKTFLLDRALDAGRGTPASPPAEQAASRRRRPSHVARTRAAAPDAAASAGEDASVPLASAPATPVAKVPVVQAPVVVHAQPDLKPVENVGSRGILLLVIGLVGIGILAMMLRAPRELPLSIMTPPDKVEPLRRPTAAPAPTPAQPQPSEKNRANGSHG